VPPRAEVCVEVLCAAPGLCLLQALARGNSLGVYMANGIADILPNKPFQVRVINTSEIEENSQGNDTRACLAPSHGDHRPR
jgi:hypothetical protein